jgi:hypothetical protein
MRILVAREVSRIWMNGCEKIERPKEDAMLGDNP